MDYAYIYRAIQTTKKRGFPKSSNGGHQGGARGGGGGRGTGLGSSERAIHSAVPLTLTLTVLRIHAYRCRIYIYRAIQTRKKKWEGFHAAAEAVEAGNNSGVGGGGGFSASDGVFHSTAPVLPQRYRESPTCILHEGIHAPQKARSKYHTQLAS